MSCTAADLINIQPLTLSDTFHTWFDRTNEVIDVLSGVNILSVEVGQTSGLVIDTGCSGGYYNGVITIDTNVGGGIGNGVSTYLPNHIVMDFSTLPDAAPATGNPNENDYVVFSDISDFSLNNTTGTPKKIRAKHMLPNRIVMGDGHGQAGGDLEIDGDVTIVGNFNFNGDLSYIDANDLRIEDKIIELAYARYTSFVVSTTNAGYLQTNFLNGGFTAYYNDTGYTTTDSSTIGYVRSVVSTSPAGLTAQIQLHSFDVGGVSDIQINGGLWVGTSATGATFTVITNPTVTEDFYSDDLLQPAGIAVKGLAGDKTFLWYDNYEGFRDGFLTNKNLGVSGEGLSINTSRFESLGYPSRSNKWTFMGASGSAPSISVSTGEVTGAGGDNSSWTLTKKSVPGHSKKHQIFSLTHYVGATGYDNGQQTITIADIIAGPSGTTYPNVPVYDWAQYFNVDQLDGAHATTIPTPYSIPVSLADGKLDPEWVSSDAIRKVFVVTGHAFCEGDIVRYDQFSGLTFSRANNVVNAESLGMVSFIDGNKVTVTTKGFVYGITDGGVGRLVGLGYLPTGSVYYLSPTTNGGMIADPDSGATILNPGEIRKAIFLSMGGNPSTGFNGYVENYTGVLYAEDVTDEVYIPSLAPAGSIMPFAGAIEKIPVGWLLCDGRLYGANEYSELYAAIQSGVTTGISVYHVVGTKASSTSIQLTGSTRGIIVGDLLHIKWGVSDSANIVVTGINTSTRTISFASPTGFSSLADGVEVRVHGRAGVGGRSTFFVPDLRGKTIFGTSSYGDGSETNFLDPLLARGELGGEVDVALNSENLPPHTHGTFNETLIPDGVGSAKAGTSTTTSSAVGTAAGSGAAFDILPPYVSMHWIIRYRKGVSATVLSGHDHDNRYIRYDATQEPALNSTQKNKFYENSGVLSDGKLGPDEFSNILTIDNTPGGATSGPWSSYVGKIPNIGAFNQRDMFSGAGLNILGGDFNKAAINIFNDNSGNLQNSDGGNISFWGVGVSGVTAWPRMIGGVYADLNNLPNPGTPSTTASPHQKTIGLFMGGLTDGYNVLLVQKVWDPENPASSVKTFKYTLPYGLTSAPVHTGQMKHVMLRGNSELVEYTGTSLSGSDIHSTGSVTLRGAQSMVTSNGGSNTSILTVDTDTGTVARKKMYEISENAPPTSTSGYPEGFIWYRESEPEVPNDPSKVPIGGIIMWSGAIDQIPIGYALCNGQTVNQRVTPDLRGRFIVGAGGTPGTYNVNDTGGANTVTLTIAQMPAHSHKSGNIVSNPGTRIFNGLGAERMTSGNTYTGESIGNNQPHENRPPYYALAYIMRVS